MAAARTHEKRLSPKGVFGELLKHYAYVPETYRKREKSADRENSSPFELVKHRARKKGKKTEFFIKFVMQAFDSRKMDVACKNLDFISGSPPGDRSNFCQLKDYERAARFFLRTFTYE